MRSQISRKASEKTDPTIVVSVTIFLLVFVGIGCIPTYGQQSSAQSTSMVTFEVVNQNHSAQWPISLPVIMVGDAKIQLGTPVHLEDHWLRHLKLIMRNVSSKTIVYAYVMINYPETGRSTPLSPTFATPLSLGKVPDVALYRPDGSPTKVSAVSAKAEPVSIPSGGMMTFTVKETETQDDQAVATQLAGGSLNKVNITLRMVYFSDDSKWEWETYFAPPTSPGHWTKASPEEFLHQEQ